MYGRLESDVQSSKKRHVELVEQCNALKKGREESVSGFNLHLSYIVKMLYVVVMHMNLKFFTRMNEMRP